jgi:hypothetical protein
MEVSCVPLYEGGLQLAEALDLAQRRYGLTLMGVVPGFADRRTGQMLQFDVMLFRDRIHDSLQPESGRGCSGGVDFGPQLAKQETGSPDF